jgi:4-hydroxy-2-oxoheptanedioate aldolase
MLKNRVRAVLAEGRPALGITTSLGSATAAGLLADAGFDFVLVDNQHGDWDDGSSLAAFRSILQSGAAPVARVRQNDYYAIGRLLDRGALGLAVPMVNTAADARAAADAFRYPPEGTRSAARILMMPTYGMDYDQWANSELFLAVQIETAEAVANAEEIMAVPGVDACWIGPNDLARSMRTAQKTPEHVAAIMSVLEACRKTGKVPGIHTMNMDDAALWIERGFRFVTAGADAGLLTDGGKATLRRLGR